MSVLLIASDSPGAGKTATTLALANLATKSGKKAAAVKPFASGPGDPDRETYSKLGYKGPVDGGDSENASPDISTLSSILAGAPSDADVTFVELPNSVDPPSVSAAAESLGASVLLVASYRRDLRAEDLSEWSTSLGDRLAGVMVNGLTRYLGTEARANLLPSLEESRIPCLGLIPEDRLMLSLTVEDVRSAFDGRYAVDEGDTDAPLEWFQVGGLSLDPGEILFGLYENNAVVVRGDRPDIQMSALNGSASCLVLTGGVDPIEYILYEAREEETPVMVIEPDTLSTMAALNEVTASPRMDSATKVERFAALLEAHADLDRLWSAL